MSKESFIPPGKPVWRLKAIGLWWLAVVGVLIGVISVLLEIYWLRYLSLAFVSAGVLSFMLIVGMRMHAKNGIEPNGKM